MFFIISLRKKCLYSEFFWFVFSRIRNKCGEIWSISVYSIRIRENADLKNYKYRHFSLSACNGNTAYTGKMIDSIHKMNNHITVCCHRTSTDKFDNHVFKCSNKNEYVAKEA